MIYFHAADILQYINFQDELKNESNLYIFFEYI